MTPSDIQRLAMTEWREPSLPWWYQYASDAVRAGRWWTIHRFDEEVYVARFWISEPRLKDDIIFGDCPFDVENSVLLHLFLRPDSDESLHDHPCSFTTTLLEGTYVEARPPKGWDPANGFGPAPLSNLITWPTGSVIRHEADDLHAIVQLKTETVWTLVRNGVRERSWGFWPELAGWMPAKEYIEGHP